MLGSALTLNPDQSSLLSTLLHRPTFVEIRLKTTNIVFVSYLFNNVACLFLLLGFYSWRLLFDWQSALGNPPGGFYTLLVWLIWLQFWLQVCYPVCQSSCSISLGITMWSTKMFGNKFVWNAKSLGTKLQVYLASIQVKRQLSSETSLGHFSNKR